jgi:hypothetical protein
VQEKTMTKLCTIDELSLWWDIYPTGKIYTQNLATAQYLEGILKLQLAYFFKIMIANIL